MVSVPDRLANEILHSDLRIRVDPWIVLGHSVVSLRFRLANAVLGKINQNTTKETISELLNNSPKWFIG